MDTGLLMIALDGLNTDKKETAYQDNILVLRCPQLLDCRVEVTKKEGALPNLSGHYAID